MNIEVRYFSRGGNTKKVADAIAKAVGVKAKDCSVPLPKSVDLLFIGGSVYWGGVDKNLKQFIQQLEPSEIKCAAAFGTSALIKESENQTEKLLQSRGISVLQSGFHCRGEFTAMHKGHPNNEDLKQAAAFAVTIMDKLK